MGRYVYDFPQKYVGGVVTTLIMLKLKRDGVPPIRWTAVDYPRICVDCGAVIRVCSGRYRGKEFEWFCSNDGCANNVGACTTGTQPLPSFAAKKPPNASDEFATWKH